MSKKWVKERKEGEGGRVRWEPEREQEEESVARAIDGTGMACLNATSILPFLRPQKEQTGWSVKKVRGVRCFSHREYFDIASLRETRREKTSNKKNEFCLKSSNKKEF